LILYCLEHGIEACWDAANEPSAALARQLGFHSTGKYEAYSASGRLVGGKPFSRGALYLILQNRLYRGDIVHNGQSHPGEHKPIMDQPLWDGVQARLPGNTAERNAGTRTRQPSLLARDAV